MVRVAICDHDSQVLGVVENKIKDFIERNKWINIDYKVFNNSIDLEIEFEYGKSFDIYILAIELPGINGIELAKRIKNTRPKSEIIFLTYNTKYGIEAVNCDVRRYILKENLDSDFDEALRHVIKIVKKNKSEPYVIKYYKDAIRIEQEDILYIFKENNYCVFKMLNGKTYRVRSSIEALYEELTKGRFTFAGRSTLINIEYISETNKNDILLINKEILQMSRLKKNQVQMDIIEFWRKRL